jgi:hypothetical protein
VVINESLKNTGRILTLLILLISSTAFGAVETILQDTHMSPGEQTVIKFRFKDGDSSVRVVKVPRVSGLTFQYRGIMRRMSMGFGNSWNGVVVTYAVAAQKKGSFVIPSFVFSMNGKRFVSQKKRLKVSGNAVRNVDPRGGPSTSAAIMPLLKIEPKRVYVGEIVFMRYWVLYKGSSNFKFLGMNNPPVTGDFFANPVKEDVKELIDPKGEYNRRHVQTYVMIPMATGKHKVGGGVGVVQRVMDDGFFRRPVRRPVRYYREEITVLPLPKRGKPSGFQGNVGRYKIILDKYERKVKEYNEIVIHMTVSGEGNLVTMRAPQIKKKLKGARISIIEKKAKYESNGSILVGKKNFILKIIPEKTGILNLGSLSLDFFDPKAKTYKTVKTIEIILSVEKNSDANTNSKRSSKNFKIENPNTVNYGYIALIIALLLSGIGYLVYVERKKVKLLQGEDEKVKRKKEAAKKKILRDYVSELKSAHFNKKVDAFFRILSKSLQQMSEKNMSKSEELMKLGQEVDTYRYGGGAVSEEFMEYIMQKIRELKVL